MIQIDDNEVEVSPPEERPPQERETSLPAGDGPGTGRDTGAPSIPLASPSPAVPLIDPPPVMFDDGGARLLPSPDQTTSSPRGVLPVEIPGRRSVTDLDAGVTGFPSSVHESAGGEDSSSSDDGGARLLPSPDQSQFYRA